MRPRIAVAIVALGLAAGCGARAHESTAPVGPPPGLGRLGGVVRDAATGAPLAFARVLVHGGARSADELSDAAGRFAVDLPPDAYAVEATFGKARARVPDVVVLERRTIELALELESTPRAAPPSAGETGATADATGGIHGVVYDASSGERFVGAVISATTPSLTDAVMAMADERGAYHLFGLPPGRYQVSVYYHLVDRGNLELRRGDVAVVAGRSTTVDLAMDLRVQR
jgi:hypothetical protein